MILRLRMGFSHCRVVLGRSFFGGLSGFCIFVVISGGFFTEYDRLYEELEICGFDQLEFHFINPL